MARYPFLFLLLLVAALSVLTSCTGPSREEQIAANETYLAKEGISALETGSAAPELTGLADSSGAAISLNELLMQHSGGLVLFFIPALDTPNTLRNLRDWSRLQTQLAEKQLGLYAVSPATPSQTQAWFTREQLDLPFLADPEGSVARAFACLPSAGTAVQRTTVVISGDAKIALYFRGTSDRNAVFKALGLEAE